MKDNFTEVPDTKLSESIAKWHEEHAALEELAAQERKVQFWMQLSSGVIGVAGFGLLAWFDWRLGLGSFLVLWSENIRTR